MSMLLCILYSRVDSFLWSIIVYWSVVLGPSAACFLAFCLLLFPSHWASCILDSAFHSKIVQNSSCSCASSTPEWVPFRGQ